MNRPIFDPESLPVEPAQASLLPVCARRLTPDGLRARFAQHLPWQPEPREWPDGARLARAAWPAQLREAAVLMPLVVRASGLTVLLTRRTDHLSHHAGQISFPGGSRDPGDPDAAAAALREAREEVGLDPARVEVLGVLPDYLTGTGFRVTPVAALVHEPFALAANAREVAEIFEVPLAFLMDPAHHEVRVFQWEGGARRFFAMPYPAYVAYGEHPAHGAPAAAPGNAACDAARARYFIWGATAGMLRNFYRFLRA